MVGGSAAVAAAVMAGYLGYLSRYATNGVYQDEWNWVDLLRRYYAGSLTLSDLWTQHNENRIFFPNAIFLLFGDATGISDIGFMYLGAAFLVAAVLLLIVACRRELLQHPLAYLPAIPVLFSLAQYENSLWAFQFAWFLVVACICGVLLLLTTPRIQGWRFLAAVAIGIVASYSLLQGLTIWAAGFVALMRPGISLRLRTAWCSAGALVAAFYLHDLDFASAGPPALGFLTRLPTAIEGFFIAVGSVAPDVTLVDQARPDFSHTVAFGVIITLAGCLAVISWLLHGRSDRILAIAAALVVVGLLFDLLLMDGRVSVNPINGTVSRYTTFNVLLLAGAYIGAMRTLMIASGSRSRGRIAVGYTFAGLTLAMVCVQVPVATRAGVLGGIRTYAAHAEAANLTANYATAPPSLVEVFAYQPSYTYFEFEAAFLEAYRLNVFGDGESDAYQQSGVVAGGIVRSPLPVPGEFGAIQANPTQWQAWLALSSVYEQRPDLQKAFPGPTTKASRRMVAWALQFGMNPADPVDAAILQPHSEQYRTWLSQET